MRCKIKGSSFIYEPYSKAHSNKYSKEKIIAEIWGSLHKVLKRAAVGGVCVWAFLRVAYLCRSGR